MTGDPSADRQYTEKEIRAILERAAKLQEARATGAIRSGGTSLAQLQQAATELGLDPDLIAQAAGEVASEATATKGSWLLGGPWKVDYDRILPGTVTEENWPLILDACRHTQRGAKQRRRDVYRPLAYSAAGASSAHAPEWSRWLRETLRPQTYSDPERN